MAYVIDYIRSDTCLTMVLFCWYMHVRYSSIITSKIHACTRMETRHEDTLFTSRVRVDHVSRSVYVCTSRVNFHVTRVE